MQVLFLEVSCTIDRLHESSPVTLTGLLCIRDTQLVLEGMDNQCQWSI